MRKKLFKFVKTHCFPRKFSKTENRNSGSLGKNSNSDLSIKYTLSAFSYEVLYKYYFVKQKLLSFSPPNVIKLFVKKYQPVLWQFRKNDLAFSHISDFFYLFQSHVLCREIALDRKLHHLFSFCNGEICFIEHASTKTFLLELFTVFFEELFWEKL